MDREAAEELATRRNRELGSQGPTDQYYLAVEGADGTWDVDLRTAEAEKRGPFSRLVGFVLSVFVGG